MLSRYKISQTENTLNSGCSRPKGSKAGNNNSKEGKADRGIEFCMLANFDLFLLYYPWIVIVCCLLMFSVCKYPASDEQDHPNISYCG